MKILAFAASNSRQSINRKLIDAAAVQLLGQADDIEVEILDLNDYEMPIYSADREREGGIPPQAQDFRARIAGADALLISFAEHNGNYTAAYKNLFDWTSRIEQKVYQGHPALFLATSPGPGGASNVLRIAESAAPFQGADLVGTLSVPKFYEAYDADNQTLTDAALQARLRELLAELVNTVRSGAEPALQQAV